MKARTRLERNTRAIVTNALRMQGMDSGEVAAALAALEGKTCLLDNNLPRLLTQTQKARQLAVSRFTIRRMVNAGKLHPRELLPGLRRFPSEEVP